MKNYIQCAYSLLTPYFDRVKTAPVKIVDALADNNDVQAFAKASTRWPKLLVYVAYAAFPDGEFTVRQLMATLRPVPRLALPYASAMVAFKQLVRDRVVLKVATPETGFVSPLPVHEKLRDTVWTLNPDLRESILHVIADQYHEAEFLVQLLKQRLKDE